MNKLLKILPHLLMLSAFLVMYVSVAIDTDIVVRAIRSLESAVYFVGSVLSYLLLNTKHVQGVTNGRN